MLGDVAWPGSCDVAVGVLAVPVEVINLDNPYIWTKRIVDCFLAINRGLHALFLISLRS